MSASWRISSTLPRRSMKPFSVWVRWGARSLVKNRGKGTPPPPARPPPTQKMPLFFSWGGPLRPWGPGARPPGEERSDAANDPFRCARPGPAGPGGRRGPGPAARRPFRPGGLFRGALAVGDLVRPQLGQVGKLYGPRRYPPQRPHSAFYVRCGWRHGPQRLAVVDSENAGSRFPRTGVFFLFFVTNSGSAATDMV